jgi:uncharacterized membrane protein
MRLPLFLFAVAVMTSIGLGCAGSPGGGEDGGVCAPNPPIQAMCPTNPATGDFPTAVGTVVRDKCQTCHQQPPLNGAPFPLLTYEDVIKPNPLSADGGLIWWEMAYVIQDCAVPHMPFGDAPQLTTGEFQALSQWLAACASPVPEGTGLDFQGG